MRVLAIVHQQDNGPGVFGEEIRARGHALDEWEIATAAEPPAEPVGYDAVLVLGGSANVDEGERHAWIAAEQALLAQLLERRLPLLGICLGGQMLAAAAGASPGRAQRPEIGWHPVELTGGGQDDPLLGPLGPGFEAFHWHSYEFPLPPGAVALARSEVSLQACRVGEVAWAIQFHPEVSAANARQWIHRADPDAVRIGIEPASLLAETEAKLAAFNQLGRGLCSRWLDVAA